MTSVPLVARLCGNGVQMPQASCFTAEPEKVLLKPATSSRLRTSAFPRSILQTILMVENEGPQGGLGSMETAASSCAPALLESSRGVRLVERRQLGSSEQPSWSRSLEPGFQQGMLDNQAINEMYCLGPPSPALGEGKNCSGSRIKHTHLALTSGGGSFDHVGPGPQPKPRGVAASARSTGGSKEPLRFSRVEKKEEPCWAKETKFTLSCSFKTTAGQGKKLDTPAARTEECRACEGKGSAQPERRTQHKGTSPTAGDTT